MDAPPFEETPDEQPLEVEDEYKLDLEAAGVDDETLLEQPGDAQFVITSYGADYTVDTLLSRLKSDAFFVPTFQRRFVWSQRHASRFIESLLMGLPVPGIFLYRDRTTNRHQVVDGQQRLRTLQYFFNGVFLKKKFRLVGVRSEWNEKSYDDLPLADRLKLGDYVIHTTIFQQDEPKDTQRTLYFVFERINSGGIRLSAQEIRNCIYTGPLLEAIKQMNEDISWRRVFGKKNNPRLKDQELILRFLAMRAQSNNYCRPMKEFLNGFTSEASNFDKKTLELMGEIFSLAIMVCWEAKGNEIFRPSGTLNAAVFEAVMLGVSHRIDVIRDKPDIRKVRDAYDHLIADKSFMRACERATADEESVRIRREMAIAAFEGA